MTQSKKKYYAVKAGRTPGIYHSWFGRGGAEEQVHAFPGARFKGFETLEEARKYLANSGQTPRTGTKEQRSPGRNPANDTRSELTPDASRTLIYTDGGCINNPGPGGYGVVMVRGDVRDELSGGYRFTTNNRMELMACIVGLKALTTGDPAQVTVTTDSRYLVNGITKGWARKWQRNNWMRDKSHPAENIDLWAELLDLTTSRDVQFVWVKGHAGHAENERCDELATNAARARDLPPDRAYEKGETKISMEGLFQ